MRPKSTNGPVTAEPLAINPNPEQKLKEMNLLRHYITLAVGIALLIALRLSPVAVLLAGVSL